MRWAAIIIGAFLIAFGVLSFTSKFPGKYFSVTNTTTQENQTDSILEDESATQKNTQKSTIPLAPVLGVISIAGGLFLVARAIPGRVEAEADDSRSSPALRS